MALPSPADQRTRWTRRSRLVAQLLVLSFVIAGTGAFATLHRTVTVDVDGTARTVSLTGDTVAEVLAAEGVEVGERDLVVPDLTSTVTDGGEIVVRHGREVVVEVDGERRTVWTTADTVGDVLADLDLRDGVRASASRSAALGRDVLRLSTVKTVHLVVDGETRELSTAAATVREVLRENDVVLGEHDEVSVGLDDAVVDGLAIMVTRVQAVTRSETHTQPFATVHQDDPTLDKGTEVVAAEGSEGTRVVTFTAYEVDGTEVRRTVLAESVVAPVDRVVKVGTRVPPPPPAPARAARSAGSSSAPSGPVAAPGTARAIARDMVLARGWGASQFSCLDSLWTKESNWRVTADNPSSSAYGIPQALPGSKMASAGPGWRTDAATQIRWGLGYISARYGTPCAAWAHSQARNWY